jgi:type VI secretion system VasD/TssJ family lipoprotein
MTISRALDRILFLCIMITFTTFLGSCSKPKVIQPPVVQPPVIQPPRNEYQKQAIHINLKGDRKLHLYHGSPHALKVCIYQLRDPNAFTQLSEDQDGILRLLECSRFDSSVTRMKNYFVQPDEQISEAFDRMEGTKYVGIVAGYYLQETKQTHLVEVPVVEEKKDGIVVQKLGVLQITVRLGPQEIEEVDTK